MDVAALATALIAARVREAQLAVAARLMRMNAQNEASVVALIDAAQKSATQLAAVAAGVGGNLDITV